MLELKKRPQNAFVQSGDSRENRYISQDYLKMQIEYLSDKRVAQNIMGMFVDSGGEIIPGHLIDDALIDDEKNRLLISEVISGQYYISGWDLARKKTATVGITVKVSGKRAVIAELTRIRKWDWNIIIEAIRNQQKRYPGRLIIDATGLGDVVVSQLFDLNPTSFIFTPKSKAELLTNLELFHSLRRIQYSRWEFPDENGRIWSLEDELRAARWDDNNQCDAVMALALALWPLHRPNKPLLKPRVGTV
jgi:hypothetical protein